MHELKKPNRTACRSAGSKSLSVDIAVAVLVHHQLGRSCGGGHFNFISRENVSSYFLCLKRMMYIIN